MNRIQSELNQQVAQATGESVQEIARRGFVVLTRIPVELDPEDHIVDWDELDHSRTEPTQFQTPSFQRHLQHLIV